MQTRFIWDEAKNRSNRRKHDISFDTAAQAFFDPLHLTRADGIVDGEQRWQTIGLVNGVLLVLVAYAVLSEPDELIRIISARKVTRQERRAYEEADEIEDHAL
ncbi:MAG: BrnT family toxin [Acidobacteriaceae bacterium]